MTESMTDDGGLHRLIPNPNLNLITRTRRLMAETRDLKEWRAEWKTSHPPSEAKP